MRSTRIRNAWMASLKSRLRPRLGDLAIPRMLFDVGDQVHIENALPIVRGIKAAIEVEVGTSQVSLDLLGHLLQGGQALGKGFCRIYGPPAVCKGLFARFPQI